MTMTTSAEEGATSSSAESCPHAEIILAYATEQGLQHASLVNLKAYGWELRGAGQTKGNSIVCTVAQDTLMFSGCAGAEYAQINPLLFSDPRDRAKEMIAAFVGALDGNEPLPKNLWKVFLNESGNVVTLQGTVIQRHTAETTRLATAIHSAVNKLAQPTNGSKKPKTT